MSDGSNLADALSDNLTGMDQRELSHFRRLLGSRLPAFIESLASEARADPERQKTPERDQPPENNTKGRSLRGSENRDHITHELEANMSKTRKIDQVKQELEKAGEEERKMRYRLMEIANEVKSLQSQMRGDLLPPLEAATAKAKISQLQREYDRLYQKQGAAAEKKSKIETEYLQMQSRLQNAQRTIETIKNPPAWGLGDRSPFEIDQIEAQARATIKELT